MNTLTNPKAPRYFLVTDVLAFFTILSVLGIVLETVPSLAVHKNIFWFIEWSSVIVFSAEYLARLYISKPRLKYSLSFFGIIDLLAILPSFLGVGNLTFLKSARVLRIMRFLRMVRMAKLARMSPKDIEDSMGVFALNVGIYVTMLFIALLVFGTALFLTEINVDAFVSIPAAMWWSFKVFIGSIPVDAPISVLGGVLYVFARFVGLILLGVLIGVVGNIFRVLVLGEKK